MSDPAEFLLHGAADILQLLRALQSSRSPLGGDFGGPDRLLTTVVGIDAERGRLLLDRGPLELVNLAATEAGPITLSGAHHGAPVAFDVAGLALAEHAGMPCLSAPLPREVYYAQRRQYFRLRLPAYLDVNCALPGGDTGQRLPVADLSVGGLSVRSRNTQQLGNVEPGSVLERCTLVLPGRPAMDLDLRCCAHHAPADGSSASARTGFAFEQLSAADGQAIQRYINAVQAEMLRRSRG